MSEAGAGATRHLPIGGCNYNFPSLEKDTTCGCQKFWLKKRKPKEAFDGGVNRKALTGSAPAKNNHSLRARRYSGGDTDIDDGGDDSDGDYCKCGHHSCFHSGHPSSSAERLLREPTFLGQSLELQKKPAYGLDGRFTGRKLDAPMSINDATLTRAGQPAHPTTISAMSGTTTERDSSTTGTPLGPIMSPLFTMDPARFPVSIEKVPDGKVATHTQSLQAAIFRDHGVCGPHRNVAPEAQKPLFASPICSKVDKLDSKTELSLLKEFVLALKNDQISQQERIEISEALPAAFEDLAEKVELIDDHVEEKLYSSETRIRNEIDDRLAPLESFIKSNSKKRKHRSHIKGVSEGHDNTIIRGDRKRKRYGEKDGEVANQPQGITTTTTTSFTTTTSTSSFATSPSMVLPRFSNHIDDLKLHAEIENLKNRLLDLEASAPPSVARPWVIDVVLIPPAPLKGIWADVRASNPNTQYTGSEFTPAIAAEIDRLSFSQPSEVVPFAFSPKSKVYKRLHSRGFIKRLHITGPSAREVSLAIETRFEDLLKWCNTFPVSCKLSWSRSPIKHHIPGMSPTESSHRTTKACTGTNHLWCPLRKIYKQAALEYLSPSDLASSALWTVDFLKANCIMKGTTRRVLYILPTIPIGSDFVDFTWKSIQKLEICLDHDTAPDIGATPWEPEAEEIFWKFDPKFDEKNVNTRAFGIFSEPLGSFGPFTSEEESRVASPIKSCVSSQPKGPAPNPQEATPPETMSLIRSRRSSAIHLETDSDPIKISTNLGTRVQRASEEGSQKIIACRKTQSTNNLKSVSSKIRKSPSPPSTPLSCTQLSRRLEKEKSFMSRANDPEIDQSQGRQWRSPTVEDTSPPTYFYGFNAGPNENLATLNAGVSGWQEDGNNSNNISVQNWQDILGASGDDVKWQSLFESIEGSEPQGERIGDFGLDAVVDASGASAGVGEVEELALAVTGQENISDHLPSSSILSPPSSSPPAHVLELPPFGESVVDDDDAGYHSI
jgi:hypothetical protein